MKTFGINKLGINFLGAINKSLPSYWKTLPEVLFFAETKNIADGKLYNQKVGATDFLTVSGSAGSETFQCPNTAPYIAADTDYIWFKSDASQRTTTTAELIGYDLQRTPVKYDDNPPNALRAIMILSSDITGDKLNRLFKDFALPIEWKNNTNPFGHVKSNRILHNIYPGMPTSLTLTGISGGVKIDWIDHSYGTAETEIWGKSDAGVYSLLYTVNTGTVTKNDIIAPVDLRTYKIRSKKEGIYSSYTSEQSIALLGANIIGNSTFDSDTWWSKNAGITIEGDVALFTNCSAKGLYKSILISGKTYKADCDATRTGGSGYLAPYGNGWNDIHLNSHYTVVFTASGNDFGFFAQEDFSGTIDNVIVKEIFYP